MRWGISKFNGLTHIHTHTRRHRHQSSSTNFGRMFYFVFVESKTQNWIVFIIFIVCIDTQEFICNWYLHTIAEWVHGITKLMNPNWYFSELIHWMSRDVKIQTVVKPAMPNWIMQQSFSYFFPFFSLSSFFNLLRKFMLHHHP